MTETVPCACTLLPVLCACLLPRAARRLLRAVPLRRPRLPPLPTLLPLCRHGRGPLCPRHVPCLLLGVSKGEQRIVGRAEQPGVGYALRSCRDGAFTRHVVSSLPTQHPDTPPPHPHPHPQSSGGVYNGANPPAYDRNRKKEVQMLALEGPGGEREPGCVYV